MNLLRHNPLPLLGFHPIYRRQTAESKYSHFTGADEQILGAVQQNFSLRKSLRRQGSYRVDISPMIGEAFVMTPVVKVGRNSFINSECIAKTQGELPLICTSVVQSKVRAKFAYVIMYSADALRAFGIYSPAAQYEIVAIHGADVRDQPEHPYEIARLVLEHGDRSYTVEEVCKAIRYWGTHAFAKSHFTRHVDRTVADFLRKGDSKRAVTERQKQVPDETLDEAIAYVNAVHRFMLQTDTLYVDPK